MNNRQVFLQSNLKFLRQRKKRSQELVAESLGMSRAKLTSYETGQVKNPPVNDLLNISAYYGVAIDTLIKIDLSKLSDLKLRELEEGNDSYIKGTNLRVLPVAVDKTNKDHIEFVPIKAKAGYLMGYNDPGFIEKLPVFNLPMLGDERKYRVFPVTGDSMTPFPDHAFVIGQFVEDWTSIKKGTRAVVITKEDGFVLKQVHVGPDGKVFTLVSTNPAFAPYEVRAEEILEIWEFKGYIDMKWPTPFYGDIDHLLGKVDDLKVQLLNLKEVDL
jgi:transcriptional regulator with XRE-family HTH domain